MAMSDYVRLQLTKDLPKTPENKAFIKKMRSFSGKPSAFLREEYNLISLWRDVPKSELHPNTLAHFKKVNDRDNFV